MNKEEINGFVVDKFNQHDLKEGAAQGTCPLCSHTRKPKNQKAQCASYDWERGLGTCHNCNTTFQLHTYQRKGSSERVYIRPNTPANFNEVSTNVETWFGTRGISKQTLRDLQVTEGSEFMPQTGKKGKYLPITITINDELDQFGNQGPVVVEQTKEERDQKSPKTYLGNVKVVWSNGTNVEPAPRDNAPAPAATAPQADDLPF